MEKREIWGSPVPYNSGKSKYEDMTLTKTPGLLMMVNWACWVFGKKLRKDNHGHDDYVDRMVIRKGKAKPTYEDIPMITPYLVPGAKTSVVVAPGGAFCYREEVNEGSHVAEVLNASGISAFVVEYRLEPYRFPIPCLDVQRAVRWVRAHAEEYGVPKNSVGVMGFSAGGYAAAGSAILLGDRPVSAPGYQPDAVDAENGMPDYVCAVYPVTSFDVNPCMLGNLKGPEFYTDPAKRKQWQEDYSLAKQFSAAAEVPFFLAYGTKDGLGGYEAFAEQLNAYPERNRVMVLEGAGHGFAHMEKWSGWWKECIGWISLQCGK